MLFNSLEFMIFFPVVCLVYYVIPHRVRYIFLLACSYFFYMCWNPTYALLMLTSTAITYVSGLLLSSAEKISDEGVRSRRKKWYVALSFASNLSILFFFKYFNFAVDTVARLLQAVHIQAQTPTFDVILPVGISFYTFQALSYTVDVYRNDIYAEKNFLKYALFVSFFPQLVAGPIERSKNLLLQINEKHRFEFERVREGLLLMLYGYFQKVVLAEYLGTAVDAVYNTYTERTGFQLLLATILFAFQIYCDFGSYSNIAIGAAKVMGFRLMENFNTPYLSRSVAEFWRRWHISLSTWFKEYVYIPLGGNRKGAKRQILNLIIVWGLTGIWHGASWNFVLWGLYYGVLLIFEKFVFKKVLDKLPSAVQHIYTMFIVVIGWGLFYFTDMSKLGTFLGDLFNFGNGICGEQALNLIFSYLPLIIAAAVASTPLAAKLYAKVQNTKYIGFAQTAFVAIVLILCTASLVNQSYNPFLYFRF